MSIALRQDGQTPFVATLTGTGRPATTRSALSRDAALAAADPADRGADPLAGHPAVAAPGAGVATPGDATADERAPAAPAARSERPLGSSIGRVDVAGRYSGV